MMWRTVVWLSIGLVGCKDKDEAEETDGDRAIGCESAVIGDVTVEETDVGMVMRATWSASQSVDATVHFGPMDECDKFSTNTLSGTDGDVLLVGLPPSTEGCFEVVAGDECQYGEFTTGPPPQGVQLPTVTISEGGDEPFLIAALILPPIQWAIDRQGDVVWANILAADRQTTDIHELLGGGGFSYNDYAADHSIDDSYTRIIGFDGVIREDIRTPNGHHAYEIFDDGRIVYLAIDMRPLTYLDDDGVEVTGDVCGDVLIELQPDGVTTREIWNAWNDFDKMPLVQTDVDNIQFYPQCEDWTHADFMEYVPARDSWLISFRNINSIIEVSDADGSWMRSVGEFGEYAVDGEPDWETFIGHPHNAHALADGNWTFMNMPNHGTEESRVQELQFDDTAKTVSVVWDYGEGLGLDAKVEGAGERLPNGNTLVNWGAAGKIQEVTPDKTVVWEATFGVGAFAGHVHAMESFYPTP